MAQVQIESRMTEAQRHEKIKEFVRQNPGMKNKADVMRFMHEMDYSSEPTAFKDTTNLIKIGELVMLKDKPNSQTHYLIINTENTYNILEKKIEETYVIVTRNFEDYPNLFKHIMDFRDFALLHQVMIYSVITNIAEQITRDIEPDKREMLYPRIISLLEFSNRINDMLSKSLLYGIDEFFNKIDVTQENKRRIKNFKNSYKKLKKMYVHLRSRERENLSGGSSLI